jgi:uncharacterized protein (TIGR02246 family)
MAGKTPEETDRLINEAISTGNAEAAAQLYEPDGVLVLPGQPEARGREAIRQAFIAFLRTKPTLTGTIRHMVVAGDLAHVISEWRLEGTSPDGEAFVETGLATDVMRRQPDGTWLYVIDLPDGVPTAGP